MEAEGWAGGLDSSVGIGDREDAVREERELPAAVVHSVVMDAAEGEKIAEIGRSAFFPEVNVMGLAMIELHRASRHGTGRVERAERSALCPRRETA